MQAKHRDFQLGRYQQQSWLTRGCMSTIYTARDRPTREQCVLKVLPLSRVSEASYLSRFNERSALPVDSITPTWSVCSVCIVKAMVNRMFISWRWSGCMENTYPTK